MGTVRAQVLKKSAAELDALFASSPAGETPEGRGRGTVVFAPGSRRAAPSALAARLLLWQGKEFRPATHDLVNLLTPFGRPGLRAEVRQDASLLDGKPCIVLDYSRSSRAARDVRDEMRQIGDGDYLGIVFVKGRQRHVYFLLSFAEAGARAGSPARVAERGAS
jgi:hypothetical protein